MVPARRLLLPILISLFLISSLFLAKKALALWVFDFDPPTLELKDSSGQVIPNAGSVILYQSQATVTITCADGTQPWSSRCESISYALGDTACFVTNNCPTSTNTNNSEPFSVSVPIDAAGQPSVKIFYRARDKAGNTTPAQEGTYWGELKFYPYKIQGFIWIDTNKNVLRDVNPQGMFTEDCYDGTATITLSGTISGSTTYPGTSPTAPLCDTYRYYSFNVPAGTYTVTLPQIPEYALTDAQTWAQSVSICNNDNPPVCSDKEINWGITDASVWWQTKLGDVRAGSGRITVPFPAKCTGNCYPYVSLAGNSSSGIVLYNTTLDINSLNNNARASVPNWRVQSVFSGTIYSYDYVNNQVSQPLPFTGAQPASSGTYKANGDATVNSAWIIANGVKIVILVNGNLNINQTIDVAAGGFLAFYVKGNINIAGDIGGAVNQDTPQLEGIYVADGSFNTGNSNKRLNIEGSIIAASFSQGRDVLGGGNKNPSFYVSYRPDFLLSAPPVIQQSSFVWQEIAP